MLDKAIKLSWTLREQSKYALLHLVVLEKRAEAETGCGLPDGGNQQVQQ
jgi:hypothetical protein